MLFLTVHIDSTVYSGTSGSMHLKHPSVHCCTITGSYNCHHPEIVKGEAPNDLPDKREQVACFEGFDGEYTVGK